MLNVNLELPKLPSKDEAMYAFSRIDAKGNNALSFVELFKAVALIYPTFDNKQMLMISYRALDTKGFISRDDFHAVLRQLAYFNKNSGKFWEILVSIRKAKKGKLSFEDFKKGTIVADAAPSSEEENKYEAQHGRSLSRKLFTGLDSKDTGFVGFEAFCVWLGQQHLGCAATAPDTKISFTKSARTATASARSTTASGLLLHVMKQYTQLCKSQAQAKSLFVKCDADSSGRLDMKELAMFFRLTGVELTEKQVRLEHTRSPVQISKLCSGYFSCLTV